MSDYKKIKYNKCPLIEVTYQINYPTILSIEAMTPVDFQERIREKYPIYNQQVEQQNEVVVNVVSDKPDAFFNKQQVRRLHQFMSEDQKWRITLAKDMLAFSTIEYVTWEDLKAKSTEVIDALISIYKPAFFSRVGLRYIDAIDRSVIGLQATPWDELLQPHLCGCLGFHTEDKVRVRTNSVNAEIAFEDVFVNISSGLGTVDRHNGTSPEEAFILNCDYFISKKTALSDLPIVSERIHDRSHSFFRESITDKLHFAMEPEEI